MKKSNAAITAIGSLLTLGAATFATVASAAGPVDMKPGMEKCYGVVKAGMNDCAGPAHACSGQSKTDAGASLRRFVAAEAIVDFGEPAR